MRLTTPRAIAEETPHAGGTVEFGPEDVEDTGTMVFVEPPGGGTTGSLAARNPHRRRGRYNEPGALAWAELLTPEPQAAVGFFQQLFGHEVTEYPQDDGGTYTTLMVDGAEVAGIASCAGSRTRTKRSLGEEPGPSTRKRGLTSSSRLAGLLRRLQRGGRRAVGCGSRRRGADRAESSASDGGTIATLKDPQGGVFSVLEV